MGGAVRDIGAILFDKDGTLFDFSATWDVWSGRVIADFAKGDDVRAQALADAALYDLRTKRFLPSSPIIAGTNREAAECFATALPDWSIEQIEAHLSASAASAPLAPAVPLSPFLDRLDARGIATGVMTNDTEYGARAHLRAAGILDRFAFVAGFDSGHGAKPSPAPLLAFCEAVKVSPDRALMVGDSTHDLVAGRAAGMGTIGVLTGLATRDDLSPFADAVLPDIGHLPDWLDALQPAG